MKIVSGQQIAESIYQKVGERLTPKARKLKLVIILASSETAALTFSKLKQKAAANVGIDIEIKQFAEGVTAGELIESIHTCNNDPLVGGIMVQLPLYTYLYNQRWLIVNAIDPRKDVDGLTASTLGKLAYNPQAAIKPATVEAILEILNLQVGLKNLAGKHIVVVNHSNLIGKPLAQYLLHYDATVTVANKYTQQQNMEEILKQGDIVITATGKTRLWDPRLFKEGAGLIDVTSIQTPEGVLGDYDRIKEKELIAQGVSLPLAWRTGVPGGVGPLTVACLLQNFVEMVK